MICVQQQILNKIQGGQCFVIELLLRYIKKIFPATKPNDMLQLYVNYPKITTLDNFNKFQIPSTAITFRAK